MRGKSRVKIPVWKQDDAAAKRFIKKVHEMFCLCLIEEIIVEEEYVLLYEAYRPSNLPFPYSAYERFSLSNKDPVECRADFREENRDIPFLLDALRARVASWSKTLQN